MEFDEGPGGLPLLHGALVTFECEPWAEYDAGQAVATMTVQARHMGLHVHQMAGFEPDGIESAFTLPEGTVPVTVVAVGRFDSEADLPEKLAERERATRERLGLEELVLSDLDR